MITDKTRCVEPVEKVTEDTKVTEVTKLEPIEKPIEKPTEIAKTLKMTMSDDDTIVLEKYDVRSLSSHSVPIDTKLIPLLLAADSFMDTSGVTVRADMNDFEKLPGNLFDTLKGLLAIIVKDAVDESEKPCHDIQLRIKLLDMNIRETCVRLVDDVRRWSNMVIPIAYMSTDVRLGCHSVEIRHALDADDKKATQGPINIYKITLYMYSETQPDIRLILRRPAKKDPEDEPKDLKSKMMRLKAKKTEEAVEVPTTIPDSN